MTSPRIGPDPDAGPQPGASSGVGVEPEAVSAGSGFGGMQRLRVPDRPRAEALADALAAFGFPLVFAEPEPGGGWRVVVCDPGTFPAGMAGHRAREAAYRQ